MVRWSTNRKRPISPLCDSRHRYVPVNSPITMARMFHHGDLDFKGKEKDSILQLLNKVPTIVDIYLDRPAVIPEISAKAKGLLADFGASDAAVLDVIFGKDEAARGICR